MIPFKGVQLLKFIETFPTDDQCKEYLYNLKFTPDFACSRCKQIGFYKGPKPYTKICKNCKFCESATSGFIFHGIKFPLRKAFCIVYDMTTILKIFCLSLYLKAMI